MGALQRDIFHAREFLEEFKDRCMYGTDFPADNLLDSETFGVDGILLNYLRCLRLNKDTWEKVTHENLEKICKL